ncbi:MAG TPA: hypothetical protein VJR06_00240 [Nitrososphaerales archaeon]|nr:hypothetical protein [Nitrososphaerales archaeon]
MRTLTRALLLFWGVYALDFGTSAYFIALGYGSAETNQLQRALIASPGLALLAPWAANQAVWIGLGAAGLLVLARFPSFFGRSQLGIALMVLSFLRLYGVATNVGFTLGAVYGFALTPSVCYMLLAAPAMAFFLGDLAEYVKTAKPYSFRQMLPR